VTRAYDSQAGSSALVSERLMRVLLSPVSLTEMPGGGYSYGPPKSAAGRRIVVVPSIIVPDLLRHLSTFPAPHNDALVFTSPRGALFVIAISVSGPGCLRYRKPD